MEKAKVGSKKVRLPNFIEAFIPIVVMIGLMLLGFVGETGYTDVHMPLVISICVAYIIGGLCGHSSSDVLAGMLDRLNAAMEAILILCTIGILVASLIISDIIPAVIYYGLDLLTPRLFLPVGYIMCATVGLACDSSWAVTATIGIAFFDIGAGLGINPAIAAGMIISGTCLGDKSSPLSDTTNLAAMVSGTGFFNHVTATVSTTAPTFVIALILYTIFGINISTAGYNSQVAASLQTILASKLNIDPLLLIPIIVVIAACVMKLPGLVGIAISVFCGVLFAATFQGMINIDDIFKTLHYGITVGIGNEIANKLLNRGGMDHQIWTINLILLTIAYGGALERCDCVDVLFGSLENKLHSVGQLVLATLLTSLFYDAVMCDQFLGIGIPVPLYSDKYDEVGLARNILSRIFEDCGTLWAVTFPWTGCGAYQMGALGVHPFAYFPFAFMNLLSPVYAVITAFLGRSVFQANGAYTNTFGKTTIHKSTGAPEEIHEVAMKNLERLCAEGKVPKVGK